MRALRMTGSAAAPVLVVEDAPRPQLGSGDVLTRVHAAGVTPTELGWPPTTQRKTGEPRFRPIPGHEFSGVVAAVSDGVADFEVGQDVYGMNDWYAEGAMADLCVTQPNCLAFKPARLTHAEAASTPISALTAWQGLFDRADVQAGERVLIHGGAGAVGVFAIQFARMRGAHIAATVSSRNVDFVRQLGAEQAIDYRQKPFEQEIRDVDVVFDTVGGDTLQRSWDVLKPSGRLVAIASDGEHATDERTKQAFFIMEPKREQLSQIAALFDAGQLQPFVDAVAPLSQAPAAYAGAIANRRGRGKIVVSIID